MEKGVGGGRDLEEVVSSARGKEKGQSRLGGWGIAYVLTALGPLYMPHSQVMH